MIGGRKVSPRPFVKWAGGKRQIVETLVSYVPKSFGTYYEPFVGGGALLFRLMPERAVISDTNWELILAYKVIRDYPEELLRLLEHMRENHSKQFYYYIRDEFVPSNDIEVAARFIYLNRTCFNGLYRVNRQGKFNVPMGRYKNPKIVDRENIMALSQYLRSADITILNVDFEEAVESATAGDFVYFDPPYLPSVGSSKFTSYTPGGFSVDDHIRLSRVVRRLVENGVFVLVSNSDGDLVRQLYAGFKIVEIEANRYISSRSSRRKNWRELLIVCF